MSDSDSEDVEYEPEEFLIGGHKLSITTISFMPIEKLAANANKEVEISGQKLWCGSLCMIQYLLNFPELVRNETVIELGAGTGVLGMICIKLGANSTTLTDHDQISIDHMKEDCENNSITASVKLLDWFEPDVDLLANELRNYNLTLVAGDVLYKNKLLKPFFGTVKKILDSSSAHDKKLLLCHIPRAGVVQQDVTNAILEHGMVYNEISRELWSSGDCLKYCPVEDIERARIYTIKLY